MKVPEEEIGLNAFDADLSEVSIEYLESVTDAFVVKLLTTMFGEKELRRLDEADQARYAACKVCQRFLEMMLVRAERHVEKKSVVDYLNSLI